MSSLLHLLPAAASLPLAAQCRVEGEAVFGEDVALANETAINGALVLPHKSLRDSIYTPGTIVM